MRSLFVLASLILPGSTTRAADYPVKLDAVRVGLPPAGRATDRDESGQAAHVAKFGAWAPVYVDLEVTAPVNDAAELVIETPDADGVTTVLVLPLNLAGVGGRVAAADLGAIGYVRPTGRGEVTVMLRTRDGGKPLAEPFRTPTLRPREPLTYLVLSLGSSLPGFELPKVAGEADQAGALRGGRIELAAVTDLARLPDQWFGYDAADLVVLNTGTAEFFNKLFGESGSAADRAKRAALLEWVRRGGRLVVGVGDGSATVATLTKERPGGERPELYRLLPLEIRGARQLGKLTISWAAGAASKTGSTISGELTATRDRFTAADLSEKPGRTARVLVPLPDPQAKPEDPIAAQAAYGLGRVTVVGFDLDRAPFVDFPQRPAFWDWVLREGGSGRASAGTSKPRGTVAADEEDKIVAAIRTHADTFDGVPVVSFGWVAILIALYILLIGPVEYFVLKRVLGRLELTWITFPIIVLTVSLAAYYSAYSLKGRDLKVNKIDVVDVDPASGRVYGTTWFTVFSPRTDTYTIGLTPGGGWGDAAPGTAVSGVGAADMGGRASLLRRKYAVHADGDAVADALEGVPVQVWSTKSFAGNWSSRFDPSAAAPLAKSDLYHPTSNPNTVTGEFTLNLPVPLLTDCVLFYAGQAYPLPGGTVRSGETVRRVFLGGMPVNQWLQKESRVRELTDRGAAAVQPGATRGPQAAPVIQSDGLPLLGVLFHEASLQYGEGVVPQNSSLRRLDQSWRLTDDNRGEVILVGRAALPVGPGEETLAGPDAASRLWLRGLPGSGKTREPMPQGSTGRQETWVRVYLPVK